MSKKTIVIGITGGIAVFKIAQLVSNLKKKDYEIHVIMSENATKFMAPLTFETLSNNRVSINTFDRNFMYDVEHISLAKKADVFLVAPATANIIGKMANGISDDMLSTTLLATKAPVIVAPAMNTNMLLHPSTVANIEKIKSFGYTVIESEEGLLACNDVGLGKLASLDTIEEEIEIALSDKPLKGKKILISAGPSIEEIDPVRYITNHSSGKMGYSIAKAARNLGADVTLVSGKTSIDKPYKVNVINAFNASSMFDEITKISDEFDVIIMSAAVADYTVLNKADSKIKKSGDLTLSLVRTKDILETLGKNKKEKQILIGFAMETENLIENAEKKLEKKNCDFIVCNSINEKGAGFGVDTNIVTIIGKNSKKELGLLSKMDTAYKILEYCIGEK